jgi:hypothetical protein
MFGIIVEERSTKRYLPCEVISKALFADKTNLSRHYCPGKVKRAA